MKKLKFKDSGFISVKAANIKTTKSNSQRKPQKETEKQNETNPLQGSKPQETDKKSSSSTKILGGNLKPAENAYASIGFRPPG